MDFFAELEDMAANATHDVDEISLTTIQQWQALFDYSPAQAQASIEEWRSDFTRKRISDSLWLILQAQALKEGYDREAYEYKLAMDKKNVKRPTLACSTGLTPVQLRQIYLIKLEGPLNTPRKIQNALWLPRTPELLKSVADGEAITSFCRIVARTKISILEWCAKYHSEFKPSITAVALAHKELCGTSIYPTLGKDATLPQHRPQVPHLEAPLTAENNLLQEQYPILYFFYGTLADIPRLKNVLSLETSAVPKLHPAEVRGGRMETWGQGKYNAMIDDPNGRIKGSAYWVMTKEHEEFLRLYETNAYEVVRCTISMETGENIQGCTFRYIGRID